jgi:hypothetical protein
MAEIKAELADGTVLFFEEGTPEDVIDRVVQQNIAAAAGAAPAEAAPADGAPTTADAVPMDGVVPQAPQEDIAGYEAGLRDLYQQYSEKKRPFAAADIEGLASKYNLQGRISNIPQIQEFFEQYGTLNPSLVSVAPDAPLPEAVKQDEIIGTVPQGGENTQRVRAFGKGVLFDFADELEAGARMLASGQMSADEYYRFKEQINNDYNAWAKANPGEALGLEAAGGIAGSFIPGVGIVGRGYQAATGIGRLAGVGTRAALVGASTGALSGIGQAKTLGDIPQSLIENAALGLVVGGGAGKAIEYGGRGINTIAQKARERFGPGIEVYDAVSDQFVRIPEIPLTAADRKAAELLTGAAGDTSVQRSIGLTALANRQGVPLQLGTSTPRMTALAEKVAGKPSSGQEDLISNLVETRIATPERIGEKVESALPGAKDYFNEEEAISDRLRAIGDNEYQRAYAVGEVKDPAIAAIINNPSPIIRSIWQSTKNLAQLKGSDLRMGMEPVLDAGGNLVGLAPTANAIPDVEALDLFKRALDDRIEKGFRGTGSEGKSEAAALKEIRNAMVSRLDELVPAYREARKKYAGDLEVRDAMRYGLDIFSRKIRPAELQKTLGGMSDAEKEAVKTGALEAAFRNLEGASGGDLAMKLAGTPEKLQKLKSIMGPQEAKFFERVMQKESQLYQRTGKITGGSRTAVLAEGMDALDASLQKGNLEEAVGLLMAGRQGMLAAFGRFVGRMNPRKEFGDQVYTKLSRALSAQKPEELREVLDMLRRSKSYTDYITSVKNVATGRAAAVTGATAGSMFTDRSFAPPPPTEVEPDPEAQLQEYIASGGLGTAIGDGAAMDEAAMQEGMAAEEQVPEMGTVMMNNREVQEGADGRMYYVDDNTLAEGISMGMYRGGSVQAFNKGGNAKSPPKRTSFFDDAIMAVSRRSNDLVAAAADLADKYGLTVPDTTAWIAQNVAGYSRQDADKIRRNLGGVSNRAIVNAGAASNETRFRNSGGVGARPANEVTPPARLSDIAYRPADVPRAVMSETPKALRAAGNYLTSTSPQTMLNDAQRAGSFALQEIMKDPYGMAVDGALYGAGRFVALPATAFDLASMRGGSRELAQYAQDNPEAAQTKVMVDALAVMPVAGAGGIVGRRLTKRR